MELFSRACQVIPGGIYGHTTPALVAPTASPYYASHARGCRYWDVDGNDYIDFMCAYGPVVLGYLHPEVEEAAARQRRSGNCFNHPSALMVELAERLIELIDFADWAVFAKNGSDVMTWSVRVAREHTGRPKVFMVDGAYHGIGSWCTPEDAGLTVEDRAHTHKFRWNDREGLKELFSRHGESCAALVLTPFHHPLFGDSQMLDPAFVDAVHAQCEHYGAMLILDDIRAGFRLDVHGSHRPFGLRPDIACYCKALGNGYEISAAVGRHELKLAASEVYFTGSFFGSSVAMAAAMATLNIIERDEVPARLAATGEAFCRGLVTLAEQYGLEVKLSGPPAMPFMTFANESNFHRSQQFVETALAAGVFLHPHHNWFISNAHEDADVAQALQRVRPAFASVKELFDC